MAQADNRLLDDLSRVVTGAMSALSGVRDEVEARMREQVEKILASFDVVQREEFEAVKAMAARAREQADALEARVAALESQLAEAKAAVPDKPKRGKPAAEDPEPA